MTLPLFTTNDTPVEVQHRTAPGELWAVGDHRVYCGDATDPESYRRLLDGDRAQVADVDGPYNMGKADWDKLGGCRDYRAFYVRLYTAMRPHLLDNASVYQWGNAPQLWRWWEAAEEEVGADNWRKVRRCEDLPLWGGPVSLRNMVLWNKTNERGTVPGNGIACPDLRMYSDGYECALFWMLGPQEMSTNAGDYWEGWEPLRLYLDGERKQLGWQAEDSKRAAGHSPKSGCHWFDRCQWAMPTQDVYEAWQRAANGAAFTRPYTDLRAEYEQAAAEFDAIRQAFYATRAPFDNVHELMTDVWQHPRVSGPARHGHPTPKPVAFARRIAKTSAREGDLCLVPFAGSSPWSEAAPMTGRRLATLDENPQWCDVALARLERWTGLTAVRQ